MECQRIKPIKMGCSFLENDLSSSTHTHTHTHTHTNADFVNYTPELKCCKSLSRMFLNGLQKKTSAVFEVAEVVPVMTNNYEESILKGARVGMNDYIFSLCFNRPAQLQ